MKMVDEYGDELSNSAKSLTAYGGTGFKHFCNLRIHHDIEIFIVSHLLISILDYFLDPLTKLVSTFGIYQVDHILSV